MLRYRQDYFTHSPRQDYFTHFEPSQSVGGAETADPLEKTSCHPQAELGLSHMWPELGSNPQRWDEERFRTLKISGLKHSATGVAFHWKYARCYWRNLDTVLIIEK